MYQDDDDRRHSYGLWGLPVGYSPAWTLQMARAHCWAPYDDVASALRSLALGGLREQPGREAARATLRDLFQHPAPFDANARFPEGAVYLSVDHGEFGQCVYRILTQLLRVEAAAGTPRQHQIVDACEAFMKAVSFAAATLTGPEEPEKPVLYTRARFEQEFSLIWNPGRRDA
uniref:Uncharacterized protein n=1 Tax=Arundo donax TaxID=35708 RepID=A0A0A9DPR6_ARUDO